LGLLIRGKQKMAQGKKVRESKWGPSHGDPKKNPPQKLHLKNRGGENEAGVIPSGTTRRKI